ncbi:hypothetical protein BDA99DRAFT_529542 [Phascolomyces articulosus]|uniref:Nucleolus and neural progenitor protein-like N-terminal domain-containing protein n=1 Tax=Phascolomyces articulosus TaxID=60185 RepID=A0AAD5JXB1_9FUNG|nr:hypothetical protein BDA99DRAFT_529542 [Phascolomyces articulosus]
MSTINSPAYTMLNPPLPTVTVLPNNRIDKKKSTINHNKNVKRLTDLVKLMEKKKFWVEVAVLDRLHYKYTNAQRSFPRFRIVAQARQLIKRLKVLKIDKVLTQFYLTFWNVKTLEKCQGPWNYIPTKEFAEYTMQRIISATLILDKLQAMLMKAFNEQTKTLKMGHWGALMLVYMGTTSRLYRLSHTWVNELQQCYDLIQPWHLAFASGYKAKQPKPDINQTCLPSTFTNARQESLESWSDHTQIPGIMQTMILTPTKSIVKTQSISSPKKTNSNTLLPTMMMDGGNEEDELLDFGEVIERV